MTDPIADYLTRVRNAVRANHRVVEIPASGLKKEITRILKEQGFIHDYRFEEEQHPQGMIKIALEYNPVTKIPSIRQLSRISAPGSRKYAAAHNLQLVYN